MPDIQLNSDYETARKEPTAESKGPHYDLIKSLTPRWLANAELNSIYPLNHHALRMPAWYATATAARHQALRDANAESWNAQNAVDARLRDIQDAKAFAEPLLKQAIQDHYGLDLNVNTTYLHIYTPKNLPWYAAPLARGVTSRNVSLLEAALHNFASQETFAQDSCYITQPNYRGHYEILRLDSSMTLEQFKHLCRELDLGARYQRHLKQYLIPDTVKARTALKTQVIASQKAALKAAAHMARIKTNGHGAADLDDDAYARVMRVVNGEENTAHCYRLNMLETPLTGILLIADDLDAFAATEVIAYIPHDPQSPLKQYESTQAFMHDLTRKLQLNAALPSSTQTPPHTYQQFFSQFVPHAARGLFFAKLTERLYTLQWHERGPRDPAPSWCETSTVSPHLQTQAVKIRGEVWEQRYQAAFNKILEDASNVAVSTAHADSLARQAWWDNVLKIAADLFNGALLVVTPFVPGLGELMMAYTVYQLADDVLESIVELSEGLAAEAAQHFVGVVTDVLQLAAAGVGATLAREVLFKTSPFVDSLKAVQVDGKQRLWNPDLAPYAHPDLALPDAAKPDALGLHTHGQEKVLRLDDQHFVIVHDAASDTHRVRHPTRPNAYAPRIDHNGRGAWVHEGEDPWQWDEAKLRRRLGPVTQALSPAEVEQACIISGTDEAALRMMYIDLAPTPPLLADSLKRLALYREAAGLSAKMRAGAAVDGAFNWSAQIATELHNWPADKAIEVFDEVDLSGEPMVYGAPNADEAHSLKISHQDVMAGTLPARLGSFLNETELRALLPAPLPQPPQARVTALRNQIADGIAQQHVAIFNHLYSTGEVSGTLPGQLLQREFAQLNADLVQRLMLHASPRELRVMSEEQRIPLRLKNLARSLHNQAIAGRAFEGFYHPALMNPDTERMVLNTLRLHTDALGDLQVTVRAETPAGAIRCQVGPNAGPQRRTLLRQADGRYQLHAPDSQGTAAQYDFFEALLRTLPAEKLDYAPGQGRFFKLWLKDQLQPPTERRTALEPPTLRQAPQRETQTLLQLPGLKAFRRLLRGEPLAPPSAEQRVRRLCPVVTDTQMQSLLPHLGGETGQRALKYLETEKRGLLKSLARWKKKPTLGPRSSRLGQHEYQVRRNIIAKLTDNWEQAAPGRIDQAGAGPYGALLNLSGQPLGGYMHNLELPAGCFDHVSVLSLKGTGLTEADQVLLQYFPDVRNLDLSDVDFLSVPAALVDMPQLTELALRENRIQWTAADHRVIARCQQLRWLDLQGNPHLRTPPDIGNLPGLEYLNLSRTDVNTWPVGLDRPRVSAPELNLANTPVSQVPEVAVNSQAARIIARSWLDRSKLAPEDEKRFIQYRRAAGIDPYRTAPAGGVAEAEFWLSNLPESAYADALQMWQDLEQEHGSQGFFDVLRLLQPAQLFETALDEYRYNQGTQALIDQVQALLIAVDRDPQLRERMFSLAGEPALCADAGAQIFNRMGVELLEANILNDTTAHGLATREGRLVTLARQKLRLDRLNQRVRNDISHRITPLKDGGLGQDFGSRDDQVDEVEVYLAYQTGLKKRLDLPWLSEYMVYRKTAGVTSRQLDKAYREVIHKEQGDGLVDGLLHQNVWSDYLHHTYKARFDTAHELRAQAGSRLDTLIETHSQWIAADASAEQKAALREHLLELAQQLAMPEGWVLTQAPLSDATVIRFYAHIERDYKELGRQLTRQAVQRAGL